MLFAAHSGLRYLVLFAGLLVVLYALAGLLGKREYSTLMARLAAVFTGLLHLQVLDRGRGAVHPGPSTTPSSATSSRCCWRRRWPS